MTWPASAHNPAVLARNLAVSAHNPAVLAGNLAVSAHNPAVSAHNLAVSVHNLAVSVLPADYLSWYDPTKLEGYWRLPTIPQRLRLARLIRLYSSLLLLEFFYAF